MELSYSVEQELIRWARAGNQGAFESLINIYTPRLFKVVRRMTGDTDEAEAILQETFWRIWKALPRYQEDRRFFPYLVTVATNLVRDAWRKERWLLPDEYEALAEKLPDNLPTPETQIDAAEQLQALTEAVADLPPAYRAVIALRYDAGLSYEEVAAALGLPLNTVRTNLRRAKAALRQKLETFDG
jgi:RNA polymerase sigma-70 factor (ECF subfamily)